jgi:hypothetical protein
MMLGPPSDKTLADKEALSEKGKSDYLKSLGMIAAYKNDTGGRSFSILGAWSALHHAHLLFTSCSRK